ncbi:MAG: Rpn family recombination-promoting nuclease/putative transposase [Myxococcales bacterium]|nr:Rpn family recombination-promoting nuclease/putative transposase [Myxococcales bacterium]
MPYGARAPDPHDALFKSTFADPRHAEGALRTALPKGLAARFSWDTLEAVPGSFVDAELKSRHTDLLFRVSLSGREARLYLLYEHQSTPHPLMPFRLVVYAVRIWESWLKENPGATVLPALVPVVLHHGDAGWTAARSLEELYDLDEATLLAAGAHVLRHRFVLDELVTETDETLRARAMSALGRLVLYCFRRARDPEELVRHLGAWADVALEVMMAPHGRAALDTVLRYVMMVHPAESRIVLEQLRGALPDERLKETLMTAGEELMQKGEARGIIVGEVQGRRVMLRKQLALRFGALPEGANARLDAADAATLDTWAERVLTAATLEDVLSG